MRTGVKLSQIPDPDTFITCPGDPIHVLYSPVIESGRIVLVESGKQSIPQVINSYKDSCDMSYILSRLAAGDASVLCAKDAFYGDVSDCSWNHAEMLQHVVDAHLYFDRLPQEIRDKFDDNFTNWIGSAGSPDWAQKMTRDLGNRQPQSDPPAATQPQSDPPVATQPQSDPPAAE